MYSLGKFDTTRQDLLTTEVEHRSTFTIDKCELNIFETHKQAENIKLSFRGFTITSMLRGKKVLKMKDGKAMNYIPGETFMLPSETDMLIDFPEANYLNPTQCTALVLDNAYLSKQLEYINETYPKIKEDGNSWQLNQEIPFLKNDEKLALLGNKIIRLFKSSDPLKDILVDIKLKEFMLSILRLQNYSGIQNKPDSPAYTNERFKAVVEYIRKNITQNISPVELSKMACMSKSVFYRTFTNEFGVPPNQMILQEKINYSKVLLSVQATTIKEVCFAVGFSDPNYFSRIFKKIEGISPGQYVQKIKTEV